MIAGGGDIAISPDNIDVSRDYLMINEDGTATSRAEMARKQRDGSIWRFDVDEDGIDVSSALRVVELNQPGRDRVPVGPGVWETSGIIDATDLFGKDTWLFDVQAHSPTTAPKPNTVEDGQLLMLVGPNDKRRGRGRRRGTTTSRPSASRVLCVERAQLVAERVRDLTDRDAGAERLAHRRQQVLGAAGPADLRERGLRLLCVSLRPDSCRPLELAPLGVRVDPEQLDLLLVLVGRR